MDLVGEVIEADVKEFVSEGYRLMDPPPLGSLVKVDTGRIEIYGVVYYSETRGRDPGRRAFALREEDVLKKKPHLTKVLVTIFRSLVLGYRDGGDIMRYLPPIPAPIHSFVHICGEDELKDFASSLDFMDIFLGAELMGIGDDVIAHFLKRASSVFPERDEFISRAIKEISRLTDIRRVNSILRRVR